MTHGKLIYINPEGTIYVSSDFNGDMYYLEGSKGWKFAEAFSRLPSGLSPDELTNWIREYQVKLFNYDSEFVNFNQVVEKLDFSGQDEYFNFWFSDYIYIRND